MSIYGLSCIVCKSALKNVMPESENQPSDGTAFQSYGHYGSTVFDPDDGSFIEINVCDECLTNAGDAGLVYTSRNSVPVTLFDPRPDESGHSIGIPQLIGKQRLGRSAPPLILWRRDLPDDGRKVELDVDDLHNDELMAKFVLFHSLEDIRRWHPPL